MSGIKRVIAEKDPDYEEITITHPSKRHKAAEQSGRSCGWKLCGCACCL